MNDPMEKVEKYLDEFEHICKEPMFLDDGERIGVCPEDILKLTALAHHAVAAYEHRLVCAEQRKEWNIKDSPEFIPKWVNAFEETVKGLPDEPS